MWQVAGLESRALSVACLFVRGRTNKRTRGAARPYP